jgi:P-type Na+/K+ transporter
MSAHSPTVSATAPKDAAYAHSPDDVALTLESDELHGLSEAEAASRLDHYGPNELRRAVRPSYVRIAARQLADPLTGLLLAAAAVSAGIGERFEAGVIAAIVVLNAVLGFFQEAEPSGRCSRYGGRSSCRRPSSVAVASARSRPPSSYAAI